MDARGCNGRAGSPAVGLAADLLRRLAQFPNVSAGFLDGAEEHPLRGLLVPDTGILQLRDLLLQRGALDGARGSFLHDLLGEAREQIGALSVELDHREEADPGKGPHRPKLAPEIKRGSGGGVEERWHHEKLRCRLDLGQADPETWPDPANPRQA